MQAYVTWPGVAALLAPWAVVALSLGWFLSAPRKAPGWRHVSAGFAYWLALAVSTVLAAGITTIWLLVGSSRADGESQMRIAWWLALLFGLGAAWCAWRIAAISHLALRWRGKQLGWQQQGKIITRNLVGVASINTGKLGSGTRITFEDGTVLDVDATASRSDEFIAALEDANDIVNPNRVPEH